jgi:hypothetical protein
MVCDHASRHVMPEGGPLSGRSAAKPPNRLMAPAAAEDRLQMSFLRLTAFCIKVVFAAIPAILILAVLLWLGGQALATFFPQLPRMQIFIHFPKA